MSKFSNFQNLIDEQVIELDNLLEFLGAWCSVQTRSNRFLSVACSNLLSGPKFYALQTTALCNSQTLVL